MLLLLLLPLLMGVVVEAAIHTHRDRQVVGGWV
jgi:hypothetical protein